MTGNRGWMMWVLGLATMVITAAAGQGSVEARAAEPPVVDVQPAELPEQAAVGGPLEACPAICSTNQQCRIGCGDAAACVNRRCILL